MATRPAGIGAGSVVGNDGEWKSATKLDHSAHLPVRNHCIDERMQILSPSPVAADGNFLNRITGEDVRNVVVAGPPLGPLIVEILPVRRGRRRLAPGTEVAGLLAWTADGRSKPMAGMDCHRVHDSLVRPQPSFAACCWGQRQGTFGSTGLLRHSFHGHDLIRGLLENPQLAVAIFSHRVVDLLSVSVLVSLNRAVLGK